MPLSNPQGLPATSAGPEGRAPSTAVPAERNPRIPSRRRSGDSIFHGIAAAAGSTIIAAIVLIALFLLVQAIPSLRVDTVNFFTSNAFTTSDTTKLAFGIRDLLIVTVLSSLFALLLAVPVSIGIALFLTQYAPRRIARVFGATIDLLAAVPSIVFGLWGITILAPVLEPVASWLNSNLGWFPLFATGNVSISGGGTIFTASIVLAVMILPIITAVTRDVYAQTPRSTIEAAQSLGATKWEVITTAVIPFGRSGSIAGAMLGLGRALGETVAILIILRSSPDAARFSLFDGGYTFASKIASAVSEFSVPLSTGAYIAAGFVLFVLTFIVNVIARLLANRKAGR